MHISRRAFLSTAGSGALTLLSGQQPANAALRGIDHLTILFKELEPAIQAYRELGFTVVPGACRRRNRTTGSQGRCNVAAFATEAGRPERLFEIVHGAKTRHVGAVIPSHGGGEPGGERMRASRGRASLTGRLTGGVCAQISHR